MLRLILWGLAALLIVLAFYGTPELSGRRAGVPEAVGLIGGPVDASPIGGR